MIDIKTDFHLHTSDDREDKVNHSAKRLIEHAARQGFKAISITNHDTFTFNGILERCAADLGILLVPGIEKKIEGKHVLILNANKATEKINTFADLRRAKNDSIFVVAPHPFFKTSVCLGRKLLENLDLFDALEYSFFYSKWFNLNKGVVRLSNKNGLPVIGNSDCHNLKYMGICYSLIRAEQQSMEGIFSAIRNRNIEVVSHPIPFFELGVRILKIQLNKYHYSIFK